MDHILVVYRTLELFNASLDRGMCHNVYKVHRGRKNIYKTHQGQKNIYKVYQGQKNVYKVHQGQKNVYKAHIPMLGYLCGQGGERHDPLALARRALTLWGSSSQVSSNASLTYHIVYCPNLFLSLYTCYRSQIA